MCQPSSPATTIAITGSTGLVGSSLISLLNADGICALPLRRNKSPELSFDLPESSENTLAAVVHLAGEPIASGRWTKAKRVRIRDSRVQGTRTLCETLAQWDRPPRVLVCASAIGFYGNRGDELLDEQSLPGSGFLAEVVQAWEDAAQPAIQRGIRVVFLRFGMILSPDGGALAKMLLPFRCGLGGRIGTGRQYWSWIALDDALGAIRHALKTDTMAGPVNVVAPQAVTNAEFTSVLSRVLRRPALVPVPAWAARVAFGQMADELLLASTRVIPRKLIETGYTFRHTDLDDALRSMLKSE